MFPATQLDLLEGLSLPKQQPCIFFYMTLDSHLDLKQLRDAIDCVHRIVPELTCRYDQKRNTWFPFDDVHILQVVERFDFSSWSLLTDPQWLMQVVHHEDYDELAIGISHIVCDGAGAKQLLQILCQAYRHEPIQDKQNIRVLSTLPFYKTKQLVSKKKNVKHHLKQTASNDRKEACITRSIDLEKLQCIAKHYKVTVNDAVLSILMKTLADKASLSSLTITCPVNLRSFLQEAPPLTITNFTGGYEVVIDNVNMKSWEALLYEAHTQMKEERSRNQDLSLLKPLHYAYRVIPKTLFYFLAHKCYHTPKLSLTNLGVLESMSFGNGHVISAYVVTMQHELPVLQISMMTYDQVTTFSIHAYASEEEHKQLQQLMDDLIEHINQLEQACQKI